MLIEGADSIWRSLLEELFGSTSPAELERNFSALEAEAAYRHAQSEKHDRDHRRKTGAPSHARLLDKTAIEDAWAEVESWASPPPAPSEEPG